MTAILFEGPDGSGKTTAINKFLAARPDVKLFPRACTSTGGPVDNLAEWVETTLPDIEAAESIHGPHIVLDRHPLVSDLTYGPITRGNLSDGWFQDHTWLRTRVQIFAAHTLVVWCMPPLSSVCKNVFAETEHMAGVEENIEKIYAAYQAMMGTWPCKRQYLYDYTTDNGVLPKFLSYSCMMEK